MFGKRKDQGTIPLRVLGYVDPDHQNGEDWVAHCLEMDIVAYGADFQKACQSLVGLIENQISFAVQVGDLSLLDRPAPKDILDRWDAMFGEEVRRMSGASSGVAESPKFFRRIVDSKWPTNRIGKFEFQGA